MSQEQTPESDNTLTNTQPFTFLGPSLPHVQPDEPQTSDGIISNPNTDDSSPNASKIGAIG